MEAHDIFGTFQGVFDGVFPTIVTLAVAVWGAFLATYQWWVVHRERRTTLKVWPYWNSTFVARLQNVTSSPVQIVEIALHGRFLTGLQNRLFHTKDEELSIANPVTEEGTPLILQPQEAHIHEFEDCWNQLEEYEIARLRDRADGGSQKLAIRSLVVRIAYGDGRVCESQPYDLYEQPSPRHSEDGHVFVSTVRLPEATGLREAPFILRVLSRLSGRSGEETDTVSPSVDDEGEIARVLDIDDDQAFCSSLCNDICNREGFSINTVPGHERLVVFVCTALQIVTDGGFANLFSNSFPGLQGYGDFSQAFKEIGSDRAAKSFEQALSFFPEGKPQQNIGERRSFIEHELREKFAEIEGEICDRPEIHFQNLAAYVRRNSDAYRRKC